MPTPDSLGPGSNVPARTADADTYPNAKISALARACGSTVGSLRAKSSAEQPLRATTCADPTP